MREVILVKFLWQDNSLFLFEMVCFKTTTEKKDFMIGKVMLCKKRKPLPTFDGFNHENT